MDITNAEALLRLREGLRPKAERMRALKAEIDAELVTWYGGVNSLFPNDSSPVLDGREAEGVSRLTGADVNSFVAQLAAYKALIEQPGVADVISKLCVRTLAAT